MRVLSIRQPWAWLIVHGYKDIENRDWPIGRNPRHGFYRSQTADFSIQLPTRIYVHAGKEPDGRNYNETELLAKAIGAKPSDWMSDPLKAVFDLVYKRYTDNWCQLYGAIIGEVDIVGCVMESSSPWFIGKYGFVLANPTAYQVPIPRKGRLGFFEADLDAIIAPSVP